VQLVIQASGLGDDGQVLVLDMGEPVRIAEVARRLVDASEQPIEIVFTGLHPGEKLHEELFGDDELGLPSEHPNRYVEAPPLPSAAVVGVDHDAADEVLRAELADLCVADRPSHVEFSPSGSPAVTRTITSEPRGT
jgi:FlaA1/EpsC-like NDP-sugar epimerase